MKPNIQIYTTSACPFCVKAKRFFDDKKLPYKEIDLTGQHEKIEALKLRTGHRTVPQIFIDEQFIGGYSDLLEKIESGELRL